MDDYQKFSPQQRSSIFASNEVSSGSTNVFRLSSTASSRLHNYSKWIYINLPLEIYFDGNVIIVSVSEIISFLT